MNQDVFLERASVLATKFQDPQGQPLSNVWTTGITDENWHHPVLIEGDSCSAYGVEKDKPRLMIFYHPAKKLIGTRTLRGDEKQPVLVKLRSGGAIKGRLLDADGKPMAGVVVDVRYRDREAEELDRWVIHERKQVVADAQGTFTLDELVPALKLELTFRHGRQRFERETKPADSAIEIKPGECRDLSCNG